MSDTPLNVADFIIPTQKTYRHACLADFFDEKKVEMEKSGKNEYVLTNDEVENFNPSDIENSFNQPMEDDDDMLLNRYNS